MSGKKGMKKYPMGIREEVVARIRAGESPHALSQEYGISRWASELAERTHLSQDVRVQTGQNAGEVQV